MCMPLFFFVLTLCSPDHPMTQHIFHDARHTHFIYVPWLLWFLCATTVPSSDMSTAAVRVPTLLSRSTTYCTVPTCSAASLCLLCVWPCVVSFPLSLLLLLFPPAIPAICLFVFCRLCPPFSAFLPSFHSLFSPFYFALAFSLLSLCPPAVLRRFLFSCSSSLAYSLFTVSSCPWLSVCIVCLRAHGGVRHAPSCLP